MEENLPEGAGAKTTLYQRPSTSSAARIMQPRALTVDQTGNIFVTDDAHTIFKLAVDGTQSLVAGTWIGHGFIDGKGAAARFANPSGIAVDGSGNLYVADSSNGAIRQISADGTVKTIIGNGQRGVQLALGRERLNRPTSVTLSPTGQLVIVDSGENAVLRATISAR